jgi:hypothetical protein
MKAGISKYMLMESLTDFSKIKMHFLKDDGFKILV